MAAFVEEATDAPEGQTGEKQMAGGIHNVAAAAGNKSFREIMGTSIR